MKETKWTPGLWIFPRGFWRNGDKSSVVTGASTELAEPVCIIPHDDVTEDGAIEVRANAHLIAAAPDLYEALERLCAGMNEAEDTRPLVFGQEVRAARAALAKARGEEP